MTGSELTLLRVWHALDGTAWRSLDQILVWGTRRAHVRRGILRLIELGFCLREKHGANFVYRRIDGVEPPAEIVLLQVLKSNPDEKDVIVADRKPYPNALPKHAPWRDTGARAESNRPKLATLNLIEGYIDRRRCGYANAAFDAAEKSVANVKGATDAHRAAALEIERDAMVDAIDMIDARIETAKKKIADATKAA